MQIKKNPKILFISLLYSDLNRRFKLPDKVFHCGIGMLLADFAEQSPVSGSERLNDFFVFLC